MSKVVHEPERTARSLSDLTSGQVINGALFAARHAAHDIVSVDEPLNVAFDAGGMRRGTVTVCTGVAAVSTALSLVASATRQGAWLACVDAPLLSMSAAKERGVALERVVRIAVPPAASRARVLGALIEGFDVVLLSKWGCAPADVRRLVSRVRALSTVLVVLEESDVCVADTHLHTAAARWCVDSHARHRDVTLDISGKRARPRQCTVRL